MRWINKIVTDGYETGKVIYVSRNTVSVMVDEKTKSIKEFNKKDLKQL